ncbi:Oidioi.mRNA.OKI2018_I69.PAR.g9444.t1.cds [Oikopleura dioica]|uniref:Oidioi.mRNA.OKI2018_I69.PAR.g9444.t1.cds n=1 Tax=Oikopleura dioica TaxID=34765 RepID=A0ABN7RLL2_OIKDI|nr:Oidioi.mRNA.OKI2018_I69.PAR.g9444.t1.cds [Oikopleura dioica]
MKLLGLTYGLTQAKSTESGIERMVDARRYDQFEGMAKVFDGSFDKRVITRYGCNCPHIGDRPLSDPGKGAPVDPLDRVCLSFKQCTKCAKERFGEECISEFQRYSYSEFKNGYFNDIQCNDDRGSCHRALCECDRMFAQTLSLVDKSTIDTGTFGFESDFDADAMCRWGGGSPKLECCWGGDTPFALYAPEYRQCCEDGSTKPFSQPCKASVY